MVGLTVQPLCSEINQPCHVIMIEKNMIDEKSVNLCFIAQQSATQPCHTDNAATNLNSSVIVRRSILT